MMFCFKSILQIWIILIGFRDTNDFVNLGICKHEFKFTCRGYCRFTFIALHSIGSAVRQIKANTLLQVERMQAPKPIVSTLNTNPNT